MTTRIQIDAEKLAELCRRYHVRQLAAFGSILRDDFDPEHSDADFLVEFEPSPASVRVKDYFAMQEELVHLLGRPVDLVMAGAVRNPYILKNIREQQQILYAA